jgi:hypothetical protein
MKTRSNLTLILLATILIPMGAVFAANTYAIDLDGTESFHVNDGSNALDVTNAYTLECWINVGSLVSADRIFDRRTVFAMSIINPTGSGAGHDYGIRYTERNSSHTILRTINTDAEGEDLAFDTWYHVAVTFDGSTAKLYVNETMVDSDANSLWNVTTSTNAINFGGLYNSGYSNQIDALMDEIRLSDVARAIGDMQTTKTAAAYTSDENTVLLMHLDDQGDPPTYVSGAGLDGTRGDDDISSADYVTYGDLSLPVELTYFKGKSIRKGIALQWKTASEHENLGFAIERKVEGAQASRQMTSYLKNPALEGAGSTTSSSQYSWIDTDVKPGSTYYYTLSDVDYQGSETRHKALKVTYTEPEENTKPLTFQVSAIYPNPFNPSTNIQLNLEETATLSLSIYNAKGQLVESLVQNQDYSAGEHTLNWHAGALSSGIYFVQISSGADVLTQKVMKLD